MKIDKLPGALVEHNISPPMGKAITLTIGLSTRLLPLHFATLPPASLWRKQHDHAL